MEHRRSQSRFKLSRALRSLLSSVRRTRSPDPSTLQNPILSSESLDISVDSSMRDTIHVSFGGAAANMNIYAQHVHIHCGSVTEVGDETASLHFYEALPPLSDKRRQQDLYHTSSTGSEERPEPNKQSTYDHDVDSKVTYFGTVAAGELGGADHILCNVHRHSGDAMDRLAVTEGSGAKQQYGLIRKGDEQCLNPYHTRKDVLGDENLGFDVIVLSYKQACLDSSMPHVQYLLNTSTIWSTGRNVLFEAAMNRNKTYLYYLFMDDDIYLGDINQTNPWRKFENFLRSVEPAIGCVDQGWVARMRIFHADNKCSGDGKGYIGGMWIDANFNAFHYKAVQHILPYESKFDRQTWWASHLSAMIRMEVLFRGQLAIHSELYSENRQHRPYPKEFNFPPQMIGNMTEGLDRVVPADRAECANAIIQQWRTTDIRTHGLSSPTMCLPPPPPHDKITPGQYACA
ncbi:hypothetical protein EMCRGX_G026586 [Ephydatia muelleri]